MGSLNKSLHNILNTNNEFFVLIGAFLLYLFKYEQKNSKSLFISLITTSFVLALFDVIFKKIILLNVDGDFNKFVVNNIITIFTINMLFYILNNSTDKITFENFFHIGLAILFYEVIIFKLLNYNNIIDCRLRSVTKIIMRLATVHILANYLNNKPFDEEWFNFSFAQIFNFSLVAIIFD